VFYGMAWYWVLSMGQEHLSDAQPSKEVGEWLEVSAKPPAKDSVLSKSWGRFVSAEQGRVPGAALPIFIHYQWSRLLGLLGTRVYLVLLGTGQ